MSKCDTRESSLDGNTDPNLQATVHVHPIHFIRGCLHTFIIFWGNLILVIFNICVIVSSLIQWKQFGVYLIPENTIERLKRVFSEIFGPFAIPVNISFDIFYAIASNLDVFLQWKWDCGGLLAMLEWILLLLILIALFVFMSTNVFMWTAIHSRKLRLGKHPFVAFLYTLLNKFLTQIVSFLLQFAVLAEHHIVISLLFGEKEECNPLDRILYLAFARFLGILTSIWALLFFFELFGGAEWDDVMFTLVLFKVARVTGSELRKLARGLAGCAKRMFALSFGVWTKEIVNDFAVADTAETFDDDHDDDDNCHELVMELESQVRGCVWLFIPMLVFLSKICESVNAPPVHVLSDSLQCYSPKRLRWIYWSCHVVILVATVVLIFVPVVPTALCLLALLSSFSGMDSALKMWDALDPPGRYHYFSNASDKYVWRGEKPECIESSDLSDESEESSNDEDGNCDDNGVDDPEDVSYKPDGFFPSDDLSSEKKTGKKRGKKHGVAEDIPSELWWATETPKDPLEVSSPSQHAHRHPFQASSFRIHPSTFDPNASVGVALRSPQPATLPSIPKQQPYG